MNKCFLICGFLGAGKTTFSKKIKGKYFNADDITISNNSKEDLQKDWESCFKRSINNIWEDIDSHHYNEDIILDIGFWSKESRKEASEKAKNLGYYPIVFYINVPDNILKERVIKRNSIMSKNHINNWDSIKLNFEEPNKDENLTIITINNY